MHLLPIKRARRILEAFWNGDQNGDGSRLDVLEPYHVTCRRAPAAPAFHRRIFTITAPAVAGPALVIERECECHLSGYNQFILSCLVADRCALPSAGTSGWRPGKSLCMTPPALTPTTNMPATSVAAHLTGFALRIHADGFRSGGHHVELAHGSELPRGWRACWPGNRSMIQPGRACWSPSPGWPQPQCGLFFDATELSALRAKVQRPHLKPHYDAILARAQALLTLKPEELIGTYAPGW